MRWLLLVVLLTVTTACPPSEPHGEPPLRPLVYTESPHGQSRPLIPGYEEWAGDVDPTAFPLDTEPTVDFTFPPARTRDLTTPEGLASALFQALESLDQSELDELLISAEDYAQIAHTGSDTAASHAAELRAQTGELMQSFRGELLSEQREGGLGSMLVFESASEGSYRLVTGARATVPEEAIMVWGAELRMRRTDSDLVFRIRIPKLLKLPSGEWRIAEVPELGGRLEMFLAMGFHLSPVLLAFEHYPLPLHTANYWTYQVRSIPRLSPSEMGDVGHEADETLDRYRDVVLSRQEYDGYALVRLRREYLSDQERRDETVSYLLTARRMFLCNRDCRRNVENIDWLLSHFSNAVTPELVFPLLPNMSWRRGGRPDLDGDYRTWSEYESSNVPAGHFDRTVRVMNSARSGRTHRFLASGIGVVLVRIDGATDTVFHELVDYRIIP